MKNILLNTKSTYILLLLMAAFPVLPKGIQSVLMIVTGLWALTAKIVSGQRPVVSKAAVKPLVALGAIFFLYLISLLYSSDMKAGVNFVVRSLPTVLFALVFLLQPGILTQKRLYNIKLVYCLAIIVLLVKVTYKVYPLLTDDNASFWALRKAIEDAAKTHGTYLGMWIAFAIVLLVDEIKRLTTYKQPVVAGLVIAAMILFSGFWLFAVGARIPLAATIVASLITGFNNIRQFAVVFMLMLCAGVAIFYNSEGLGRKIAELKNYNFTFPHGVYQDNLEHISSEQVRNGIYFCAFNKIKEAPVAGYGVGDVDNELQNCYDATFTDTDTYKVLKYNSHSQYLQLILSTGIVGFLFYFICYGFLVKKAIKSKQVIYLAFLIFMLINFLFENILSRHDGVLFFGLFNALFFFQDKVLPENEESLS